MVNNKKYIARMLSLALFACTASVFVKGVVSEEEKETPTRKKYQWFKKNGYADKEWMAKKIMKDIDKDPERALEIIEALGVDPNMPVNNKHLQAYTLFGHTVKRVITNAYIGYIKEDEQGQPYVERRCNIELIKKLFDLGADLDKMTGWIYPSQSAREVVRDKSNDHFSCERPTEQGRLCARAIERFFNGINELTDKEYTDEEKVDKEYKEYLKSQHEKK